MGKEWFGFISLALNFFGYAFYFISIFNRKTKPHLFSWIVWGLVSVITFAGQFVSGAGAGSWAALSSFVLCMTVAATCHSRGEKGITRGDWIAFVAALSALPLWYFTNGPLWSMIMLAFIDTVGSYPTIRKSYDDPYGESYPPWSFYCARDVAVLFALDQYSITTMIVPIDGIIITSCILLTIFWRRRIISPKA